MQAKTIPGCQGETAAAQMDFASELPLSQGDHSSKINSPKTIIQANPEGKKWGNSGAQ